MTAFVLNITGLALNITVIILNMTGFDDGYESNNIWQSGLPLVKDNLLGEL